MNNKIFNTCNYSVDAIGGAYGLANIQTILGIIVLSLTIFNVLFNMVYKIIKHIKNRQIEAILEDINEAKEELEEVQNGTRN